MPETNPKPDPRPISTEYHKARKQLMLWAAILFIWELIGIDLEKAKEAGGNAAAFIGAIKSPQAIPWVLLILVVYFLFKCTIEWGQCHVGRRKLRFARIDFVSAWIVSLGAIVLYIGQTISQVQFADVIQGSGRLRSSVVGLSLGFGLTVISVGYLQKKGGLSEQSRFPLSPGVTAITLGIAYCVFSLVLKRPLDWRYLVGTFFIGVTVVLIIPLSRRMLGLAQKVLPLLCPRSLPQTQLIRQSRIVGYQLHRCIPAYHPTLPRIAV